MTTKIKMSEENYSRLLLAIASLIQETPFGHRIHFTPELKELWDRPMDELTDAEAEQLIADCFRQREAMFKAEVEKPTVTNFTIECPHCKGTGRVQGSSEEYSKLASEVKAVE